MYANIHTGLSHVRRSHLKSGGICKLLLAKHEDVLSWPPIHPVNNYLDGPITLKSGKSWFVFFSAHKTRNYAEEEKTTAAGHYIDHRIIADIPGDNAENTSAFKAAQFHDYVLVVKDHCGVLRLIGNPDCGATLLHKYNAGTYDNSRKRQIEFFWQNEIAAPLLTSQTFIIDGEQVEDLCGIFFPPGENPVITGTPTAPIMNEVIQLTGVASYTLDWNATRQTNYGTAAVIQVFIKDNDSGNYIATSISIIPNSAINPSSYQLDFGGVADVIIVIT